LIKTLEALLGLIRHGIAKKRRCPTREATRSRECRRNAASPIRAQARLRSDGLCGRCDRFRDLRDYIPYKQNGRNVAISGLFEKQELQVCESTTTMLTVICMGVLTSTSEGVI
jgi:hypothetical protein